MESHFHHCSSALMSALALALCVESAAAQVPLSGALSDATTGPLLSGVVYGVRFGGWGYASGNELVQADVTLMGCEVLSWGRDTPGNSLLSNALEHGICP